MKADDLQRFAADLQQHAGVAVELELDSDSTGLHILRINGVDCFFRADAAGYDGWGKPLWSAPK